MTKPKRKTQSVKKNQKKVVFPEWPFNEKQSFLVFAGVVTLLTVILFSPYLFGEHLFIFTDVGSDTITVFFPNLVQEARYFQQEGIPGWSFYIGLGSSFYPGYLLNPFHWIFLPMGPEAIAYTLGWVQASVLILTGLVFYRFLKETLFSLPVCFLGGLLYAFGGYLVLGNTWYGHAYVVFWMTCSFLGFELLLRRKIWWLFPIPFLFILGARSYFLVLFMAIYGLVRMLDVYGPAWKEILHGYKRMIILGILGLLLAAPFIGGKLNKFANSPRVSGDVSYSGRLIDHPVFEPSDATHNITALMRVFSTNALGNGSDYHGWRNYLEAPGFYMGLITLLFVFQFFVLAERRRKWIYGIFLLFWLVLIVFPWFRYAFYGFAGNYYKGALSLFIPFSFMLVALMGFQEVISQQKLNKGVLFGSLLFWLILLWYPYDAPKVVVVQSVQLVVSVFLIGHALWLWLYSEGVLRKFMYFGMIGLISLEVVVLAWPVVNHRDTMVKSDIKNKNYHFDDSKEAVQQIKEADHDLFYRIDKVYGSIKTGYNDGMVQDFFGSKSYRSHNHKLYVEFLDRAGVIDGSKEANTRWLVGLSATNLLHGLFSIKYLLTNQETMDKVDKAIYTPFGKAGSTISFLNTYYIPFGIPFENYISIADYDQLSVNEKRRSFYLGVVAEDDAEWTRKLPKLAVKEASFFGTAIRDGSAALAQKAMKMEYFSQKRIIGSISLEQPSMMFFSIPFDRGWHAKANGKEQQLEIVDFGFTGMYLEPGDHVIELYYSPPFSRRGWLGLIFCGLGVMVLIRFRKYF